MMQVVTVCSLCARLALDTARQNQDYSCLQLIIFISHLKIDSTLPLHRQ